ncbi:regulatory protein RecX [Enterobacter sp. R1(2018)]|uniref:regulatory protein RecX n=1 Tax=Enterobacter sp. R1(2018) TaxID=2447891 RepID=UPI000EAD0692|nr:regulatory protein RecX [Enterobacter sp. R1(2018)]RKQ41571.1 regulatory protein RecX [Enterobacter sp. R1(2018)]
MPESSPTPRRSAYARLLDKATRILAMRDHSEHELRRKLTSAPTFPGSHKAEQPDFTPEDIEKVIAWCYEHRWLDDAQFAARFIASRSRKGYGPQRIRQELQQKGIDRATGEAAMMESEVDWQTMAREIAERKFGDPLPTEWKERAKVQRFLLYRGFFMEDIQGIYRNFND